VDRAACRRLQRDQTYGHIHEAASASASKPRAPYEARDPLAFARRSPNRVSPVERAVRDAPWAARSKRFAPSARPRFRESGPRCSHGSAVLKRRARSLLGVLRAPLLRRQPSIPSSPTRCHGGLESLRRASRGPSRQVSLAERGRVRQHGLAEVFVRRRPAKVGVFPKTRVLSTDRRRAGGRVAPRPCGSVCPSRRPP